MYAARRLLAARASRRCRCSCDGSFSPLPVVLAVCCSRQQLQLHRALDVVAAQRCPVSAWSEPKLEAVVGVAVGTGGDGCAHYLQWHGAQRVQYVRQQAATVHALDAHVADARIAALVHIHARHRTANRRRQAGQLRWCRAGGRRRGGVRRACAPAAAARCSTGGSAAKARNLIFLRRAAQLQALQRVDGLLEHYELAAPPLARIAT